MLWNRSQTGAPRVSSLVVSTGVRPVLRFFAETGFDGILEEMSSSRAKDFARFDEEWSVKLSQEADSVVADGLKAEGLIGFASGCIFVMGE